MEDIKGWFFVLVTALLLGVVLNHFFRRIRNSARELQDSEAKLHLVGDNLPDSYVYQFSHGTDGKPQFTYISAGVERIHGVKVAAILQDANCLRKQIASGQQSMLAAAETESARNLTDFAIELQVRPPDGVARRLQVRARPRRNSEGLVYWDGFATDITSQKQAVEALQRSEQNYREIFNATNDAIFLHDAATGRVVDVNDAMLRMHGYDSKADYLQGQAEQVLVKHPQYNWEEAQRLIRLAVENGPQVLEWINHKKNGEPFWVEVSLRSSEIGGQGFVLAVVRDISQRKAQEIEISRLTRLYATLSQVNQAIVRCQSRKELLNEMCRVLIEFGKFRAAWIGEQKDSTGKLMASVNRTVEPIPSETLRLGICEVTTEAMRLGAPALCNHAETDPRAARCREMMRLLNVQSCAAFPLHSQGEIVGAFSVCTNEPGFFRAEEIRLLEEIACDLSYALDRLDEQEQRRQAEAALQRTKEFNKAVLDSVTSHIAVLDSSGVIVAVNERWNEFARTNPIHNNTSSKNVEVGVNYLTICRQSQGNSSTGALAAHDGIRAVLDGQQTSFSLEYPCDSLQEKRWFSMIVSRLGNNGDGVVVSHTNITERKLAEAALHETNQRLQKILEVETVGVMFWEMPSGVLIDANSSFLKLMGYSRREVEARELTWQKLTPSEFIEVSLEEIQKFETTGRVGPYEKQYLRKDGTRHWLLFAGTKLDSGTIVEFGVDISARKHAEAALRESEKKHRSLYESSHDAILTLDLLTQKFTSGNPAALEMFGAKSIAEMAHLGPSNLSPERQPDGRVSLEIVQGILATLKEKVSHSFEWKHQRLNGEEFLADVLLTWLEWDGRPAIMTTIRDITVRKEAEVKLVESEQRFRALIETAPEAIFVRTGEHFAYVNVAALKLFGASSPDQLLGQRVLERFQQQSRQIASKRIERMDDLGENTREEDRVLLKLDGAEVEASISAVPIAFEGKPSALVIARDISDRKRAEAAQWQQFELQEQLAKIAATVPGTIYSFKLRPDGSMAMPYASAALEQIFGVKPEQVREDAAPILAMIHPEDARQMNESIITSARTLKPWRVEFRVHGTREGDIWVEGNSVPQLEPDGSVLWHGFLYDITERKQAEHQLRKLSRAVEQSPASIVITDCQGKIEYVNPKFTELTGYQLDEVRGQNPRILKCGDTSAEEYRQLWQTIKRGETWQGEFRNRKKNGEKFWEFASISSVTDDAGNITHFLAVKEDITERKLLEAQFRQSQKLEAIGQLAGGVAHDFNNILGAMMMQAELSAMAENIPEEVREGLQEIRTAMDRAANLTRQLLLFSRKQVLQPRDLDLNEVVTSLAKMLQRLIREDVRLQLNLHPSPLISHADAGMLDQVLMNLAVNARDAMPNGGHLFIETSEQTLDAETARIHPDAAPGRYVSFSVTDTGSGISPEVLPRIFDPFFTTKEPGKGTGLGLATVFGIIKQHQGWITASSEVGKGACFRVYLPALNGEAAAKKIAAPPVASTGTEMILLVEDENSVRRMTRTLLQRQGYTVIEAANGADALQLWKQHRETVALLLTDLVMPGGITGQQLARELQANKPSLKVVFTSGYSAEIAGGEIHLRSGQNFLQKPCPPILLLQTIRKTLES